jgi:hypothetical protein
MVCWRSKVFGRSVSILVPLAFALACGPPAVAAPEQNPPDHPFLTFEHPQNWTVRSTLRVRAWQDTRNAPFDFEEWNFTTAAVVFPIPAAAVAANLDPANASGKLSFNDTVVTESFTPISGYHSGATYARFDAAEIAAREMELVVEYTARCWRTSFDEQAATAIPWPTGEYPPIPASTLTPQIGVELPQGGRPEPATLDRLLMQWTDGASPRSIPPVTFAKWIAAKVVDHVQPNGDGLNRGRYRLGFEGFQLQGAPVTARTGRGSPFDATALLAAMYRRAGLPARIVIAYRESNDKDDRSERRKDGASRIRAYVEFYLYDEANDRGGWIPVDVAEQRRQSSRARPIDQRWDFFGNHKHLDLYIPLAYHFHPPTTVRSYGSPALWGWFITPTPPGTAYQQLAVTAYRTPVTASGPVEPTDR